MGLITDENVHVAYVHVLCPKISSRHILPNYLIFHSLILKKIQDFPFKKIL